MISEHNAAFEFQKSVGLCVTDLAERTVLSNWHANPLDNHHKCSDFTHTTRINIPVLLVSRLIPIIVQT